MNAIFCCADRVSARAGLQVLKDLDVTIDACLLGIDEKRYIADYCKEQRIRLYLPSEIDELLLENPIGSVDLLISFAYSRVISKELIAIAKKAVNLHPAPLPEYRGCGTSSQGVYHGEKTWGVTLHELDEMFDTGDIIEVRRFAIEAPDKITGIELFNRAWEVGTAVLRDFIIDLQAGKQISVVPQSEGAYYGRKELAELKRIDLSRESADLVSRKIRALWFPPYEGAYVEHDGKKFYLINEEILKQCESAFSTS